MTHILLRLSAASLTFTLTLTLTLFSRSALAQTVSIPPTDEAASPSDDGSYSLGGALLMSPQYAGAKDSRVLPLPYISLTNYKGFDFTPFTLSYSLVDVQYGDGIWAWGVKSGPQVNWEFGRQEDDADELVGLGDLDSSLFMGGYSRVRLGPIAIRFEGGQDVIDGAGGSKLDTTIGTYLPIGKGSMIAGYTLNWGSDDYVQSYFGVSQEQAVTSQFNAYELSGDVYANTATLLGQYPLKRDWNITALASYRTYTDDVAASPILSAETGSSDGLTVVLGLSKKFSFKN